MSQYYLSLTQPDISALLSFLCSIQTVVTKVVWQKLAKKAKIPTRKVKIWLFLWNIWLADNAWAPALTHYYNLQLMSLPSLLLTHRVIKCFGLHKTQKGYLNRFWRRWRLVGWFLGRVNIPQYLNSMNLNVIRVQGREYAFENKFRWF